MSQRDAECLDEATVLAFLDGSLSADARAAAEAHLAACSACMELTTWAAADAANLSRVPGNERQPLIGQLAPGTQVGCYQILGGVGRGGMGEVYAAYHPDLDRRIALKVVHEACGRSPERRVRLLREARAIARLSHPNIVAVHDAGTVGDRVFIAMELIDGETIDSWLRREPRNWRQILEVFMAAGRGLDAAHAAGIVHRDFKPQNVMIARDGVVRVMDFGLAQMIGEAPANDTAPDGQTIADLDPDSSTVNVTRTGSLMGTPAYMAPEQFLGEPIDARADQFSFCVALQKALFGDRPTVGPAALRRVLLRGAAPRAADRYPSMGHLLRALASGRTSGLRRAATLAGALCVGLAIFGGWRLSHARLPDCAPPRARLAAAWAMGEPSALRSDPRRQAARGAIAATGRPDAETIWERLAAALDGHMVRWDAMYRDVCASERAGNPEGQRILDLRMDCLTENLDEVRAFTDVVLTADGASASTLLASASDLTPVGRCADLATLRAAPPPPKDLQARDVVRALRRSIADAKALHDAGRYREAMAKLTAAQPEVEASGHRPLQAELLSWMGLIESELAEPEKSKARLTESLVLAEAAGDDLSAARATAVLVYVVGHYQGKYEESELWARLAHAIIDRLGAGHDRLRAWVLHHQGLAALRHGDPARAVSLLEQSVAIKTAALGSAHPEVARSLSALGWALQEQGRLTDALAVEDRALALAHRYRDLAYHVLNNRGEILLELGRHAEAAEMMRQALGNMRLAALNDDNTIFAHPLTALGEIKLATGEPAAALPLLERALRIREDQEPDEALTARTRFALARALWNDRAARPRARALAKAARGTFAAANRRPELERIDNWMKTAESAGRRS